jgi:hypothetical protein
LRSLGDNIILPTGLAYVQRANDIVETFFKDRKIHFKEHDKYLSSFTDDDAEDILRYMKNLQAGAPVNVENSSN